MPKAVTHTSRLLSRVGMYTSKSSNVKGCCQWLYPSDPLVVELQKRERSRCNGVRLRDCLSFADFARRLPNARHAPKKGSSWTSGRICCSKLAWTASTFELPTSGVKGFAERVVPVIVPHGRCAGLPHGVDVWREGCLPKASWCIHGAPRNHGVRYACIALCTGKKKALLNPY